jgi:hypothetical protein
MNVISRIRQTHIGFVASRALFIGNLPNPITFTTSDPVRLPLPSPRYLGIHAACCKVARLSGAVTRSLGTWKIHEFYRSMDLPRNCYPML